MARPGSVVVHIFDGWFGGDADTIAKLADMVRQQREDLRRREGLRRIGVFVADLARATWEHQYAAKLVPSLTRGDWLRTAEFYWQTLPSRCA